MINKIFKVISILIIGSLFYIIPVYFLSEFFDKDYILPYSVVYIILLSLLTTREYLKKDYLKAISISVVLGFWSLVFGYLYILSMLFEGMVG